jgi:hypothetical protein
MNALLFALLGIYLVAVGVKGNYGPMTELLKEDAGGFLPWAIAIGTLAIFNEVPSTQKLVGPVLTLLVIAFVLTNYDRLKEQFQAIQNLASGNAI